MAKLRRYLLSTCMEAVNTVCLIGVHKHGLLQDTASGRIIWGRKV